MGRIKTRCDDEEHNELARDYDDLEKENCELRKTIEKMKDLYNQCGCEYCEAMFEAERENTKDNSSCDCNQNPCVKIRK
jgi:hypothetical protein